MALALQMLSALRRIQSPAEPAENRTELDEEAPHLRRSLRFLAQGVGVHGGDKRAMKCAERVSRMTGVELARTSSHALAPLAIFGTLMACTPPQQDAAARPCGETCSDADLRNLVDVAGQQLLAEGVDLVPDSWNDPAVMLSFLARVDTLAGLPPATNVQRSLSQALTYNVDTAYCGTGWLTAGDGPLFAWGFPGDCLNRVCFEHDQCYSTIEPCCTGCVWSNKTDTCDADFFAGAGQCAELGECPWRCRTVRAIAAYLKTLCVAVSTYPQLDVCDVRASLCDECSPTSADEVCSVYELSCGVVRDGCGGERSCGSCANEDPADAGITLLDAGPTTPDAGVSLANNDAGVVDPPISVDGGAALDSGSVVTPPDGRGSDPEQGRGPGGVPSDAEVLENAGTSRQHRVC
jgi:hypothetical protein